MAEATKQSKGRVRRRYENARHFEQEGNDKLHAFEAIMGTAKKLFEELRQSGIECPSLRGRNNDMPVTIQVTKSVWNHVFKHPFKRRTKGEKLARAIAFPEAVKLIKKNTTYQELSREKDRGSTTCLYFAIIGYIRGNRMKAIIRRQEKRTNQQFVLHSFYQMSSAPSRKQDASDK